MREIKMFFKRHENGSIWFVSVTIILLVIYLTLFATQKQIEESIPVDIQRKEVKAYEKQVDMRMDTMLKIIGSHMRLQKHVIELESRIDSLEQKLKENGRDK